MSSERRLYVMKGSLLPSLILAAIVVSELMRGYGAVEGVDTLSLGGSLRGNETIVSLNGTFELGFFNPNPNGSKNWYLGMWYAKIFPRTYVWVANRESPVKNMPGTLNLSRDGQLGLFDAEGAFLWSPNGTKAMSVSKAVLMDTGNFVMLGAENKSETVWESFDHPADTFLPGMRIGGNKKLISWRNSVDPSPGIFSFGVEESAVPQLVLIWNNSVKYWESGGWNGKTYVNIPEMAAATYVYNLENTTSGAFATYRVPAPLDDLPRFVMDKDGVYRLYKQIGDKEWMIRWNRPTDQCKVYGLCGVYGICNANNIEFCSCLQGFKPRDEQAWGSQEWWTGGCVRRSSLNCGAKNSSAEQLMDMSVSLPDNSNDHDRSYDSTLNDCKKACLSNCSCTALKYASNICQIWRGDLLNMRNDLPRNDSEVFVRVAASEFGSSSSSKNTRRKTALVVGGVVVACAIILAILACLFRRRFTKDVAADARAPIRMFTYKELEISTKSFTHKLGSGAFGSVFRGTLSDGILVAVKKLQAIGEGEKQFRAEINTVGNINHVNLIRLRGFCAEKAQRLLVYDYMPNGSLNTFLFNSNSKNERKVEEWKTRFEIALGVARGLVYLHEGCRERIIHCDVKPENILLDDNFCPKLADFGLAKLVGRDFSRVLTTTRGTRGYLAPEWIAGLPITPKADVYSFGMTLLEILSGRRNLDMDVQESSKCYFQIRNEGIMSLVDSRIANSVDDEEVRRAAVVSMLCIQDDETVRPCMSQVLQMLEGRMDLRAAQIPRSLLKLMDQQGGTEDGDSGFGESNAPKF